MRRRTLVSRSNGAGLPRMLTATTIRVRGVRRTFERRRVHIKRVELDVDKAQLQSILLQGVDVVAQDIAGTMTSSPRCRGRVDR